ncbi:hypothetical protein H9I45_15130 [Polaribacter haliotis]|uniref:Phage gp6-like head-tail connector protein n=1 Tax=Polaribacter haliotis TaxID=1888915 RepID=A0A7L8AF88_9FLAO|nr:hypothetical protein [Polaribacter haliotis]QOD60652.1 hypothetical protein H9I45_15130 [Polaribacter haliotis]
MAFYTDLNFEPAEPIVTLAEFKTQIKELDAEEETPEDALWQNFLDASLEECESYINRAITTKKYKISGKSFNDVIVNSLHTIIEIEKIEYKSPDYTSGSLETLSTDSYSLQRVDTVENKLEYTEGITLPTVKEFTPDAVQLYITVGLVKVSKKIKQAILLKAAAMDKFRADYVKNKPTASESLLNSFIRY